HSWLRHCPTANEPRGDLTEAVLQVKFRLRELIHAEESSSRPEYSIQESPPTDILPQVLKYYLPLMSPLSTFSMFNPMKKLTNTDHPWHLHLQVS
ncbi:Hypothetical protein FKW44_008997, partial [Caligus rogercresseyi]